MAVCPVTVRARHVYGWACDDMQYLRELEVVKMRYGTTSWDGSV